MKMPDLATTGSDIRLIRWLIKQGNTVQRGQPLLEIETDKAISQVESIATGVLKQIRVPPDSRVSGGQVIAVIELMAEPEPALEIPATATPAANLPTGVVRTAYKRDFLLGMYERMLLIREFEERVKFLFLEGSMPGTIHQCHGQEATAVGVCAALKPNDWITSTFRGHGHALAKGLSPQELLDELFGATTGCCKGRGGSMHVGNMDKGMVPGIAIVAAGIPLATGMALAFKMQKSSQVVACFFGDGAVAEGAFHEAVNMASLWNLPVIFICENNLYGASTHISKVMKNTRVADRALSYGFRGQTVDGNDVIAVFQATRQATLDCRSGNGPVLLELLTYRRTGHSRRDPCHYQPTVEREAWSERDPLDRFATWLAKQAGVSQVDMTEIKTRVEGQIEETVQKARQAPLAEPKDIYQGVYG